MGVEEGPKKKKRIDTSGECYHLAIQNLCTSSSLTWAYIPGSQHPWARWVEGVSRVEEGPKKKNAIDTSVKCYHLATQNLCTSSSLTWAYIPGGGRAGTEILGCQMVAFHRGPC